MDGRGLSGAGPRLALFRNGLDRLMKAAMRVEESTDRFSFARGRAWLGWAFVGVLAGIVVAAHQPLYTFLSELAAEVRQGRFNPKDVGLGALCMLLFVAFIIVATVIAAVNGLFASCTCAFDKTTGRVSRHWSLGPLQTIEQYPIAEIRRVGSLVRDLRSETTDSPSWYYTLYCFFHSGKRFQLACSSDKAYIDRLTKQLQAFLGLPEEVNRPFNIFGQLEELAGLKEGALASWMTHLTEKAKVEPEAYSPPDPPATSAAVAALEDQLRTDPNDVNTLFLLAIALRTGGRPDDAVRILEEAIRLVRAKGDDSRAQELEALLADWRRT